MCSTKRTQASRAQNSSHPQVASAVILTGWPHPPMRNWEAHGIDSVLKLYQHSDTLLKWFPFKLGRMISIKTKANFFFSLPIPPQPQVTVAQSTSSFGRALKVHTLSQICWFHCCIPQGRQSTDVEPKNRKTEKQNKNSWTRHLLLHSKIMLEWMVLSPQAQSNKKIFLIRDTEWRKISLLKLENASKLTINELSDDFQNCFPFSLRFVSTVSFVL